MDACSLLCHEQAKHLHVLTVEVWTGDLEKMTSKRKRLHSIPVRRHQGFGVSVHQSCQDSSCALASWLAIHGVR